MNKLDFIQPKVENVLYQIDFIKRLEAISLKFSSRDEKFQVESKVVIEICNELKLKFKYSKAKEYYLKEKVGDFDLEFGFSIRYQSFDFGITIKNPSLGINSSAPWDFFISLLTSDEKKIGRIKFRNYDDIREILINIFDIYNEIKKEFSKKAN